jgi:hypothetical protein
MTEPETNDASTDFALMDREDEEQILAELRGAPVDKFIYENKRGEWDLTYAGTKWVVRKMAEDGEAIRVDGHPKVERCPIDPEYITCTVLGSRYKVDHDTKSQTLLDTNVGAARGWIKMQTRNGPIPDEFFFNKTTSRAIRNLMLALIPTDFKRRMIDHLRKGGAGASPARSQGQGAPQGQRQQTAPAGAAGPGPGAGQPAQGQGGAKSQGQAAPPAGQGATQQKTAGAAKPPGQRPPPGNAQRPAGGGQGQQRPAGPGEAPIETVQQQFNAVLQAAVGNDKGALQRALKSLTGKTLVTELARETMVELGPILRLLAKKEVKWTGTAIVDPKSGTQLWPKPAPQPDPQPEPSLGGTPDEPPPQDEIPMF